MKVLITGANGFIGSSLVGQLKSEGYEVVEFKGDITVKEQVEDFFQAHPVEGIFHVAALLPGKELRPADFLDVNVKGTLHILEACLRHGIKKIVYSSSMSVYGHSIQYLPVDEKHPTSPYDFYSLSKLQGEEVCRLYARNHGLHIAILRYSGVYGPRKKDGAVATFFQKASENKSLEITGDTRWDIVYVKDVARANLLAMQKLDSVREMIVNIGSGEETSVRSLAEKIVQITGSKSSIQTKESEGNEFRFVYDMKTAKELLNFTPLGVEEGLRAYYDDNR